MPCLMIHCNTITSHLIISCVGKQEITLSLLFNTPFYDTSHTAIDFFIPQSLICLVQQCYKFSYIHKPVPVHIIFRG